jgi:hypothetical protein
MPDCFISYASAEEPIAKQVYSVLSSQNVEVFLAPLSLRPGDEWSEEIKKNLRDSSWVLFLASRDACESSFAQQEVGMAIGLHKKLVPIIWDIAPSELPGWLKGVQAIDLRGLTVENANDRLASIAKGILEEKKQLLLFAIGAIILAFLVLYWTSRD